MQQLYLRHFLTAFSLAIITTLPLWLWRTMLTPANFSLIYLLVVLIVAMRWGTGPSMLTAVTAFLCFNYFLIEPLYTFRVADPHELIDLLVFFICAALTGQLASYARQQTGQALQRTRERDFLFSLTSQINQLTESAAVIEVFEQSLMKVESVQKVRVRLSDTVKEIFELEQSITMTWSLSATGNIYGYIAVEFDHAPSQTLQQLISTACDQVSIALQRIDLTAKLQQSKTVEEADKLKTAILHSVSHDLRTPITIIKTSASNLLTLGNTLPDIDRVDMIKTVDSAADRLNRLVGNLLDMSRLKAGVMHINSELNSLEEVTGDVIANLWTFTHQERVKMNFPDDLPLVSFDYGLILQALTNVVENSVRYEPADKQVEILTECSESEVRLKIVNHGPSLSPEEQQRVMEPFYHTKDGNTGLGLAIAQGIIDAHHGTLKIENTPSGGVTFIFALPANAGN